MVPTQKKRHFAFFSRGKGRRSRENTVEKDKQNPDLSILFHKCGLEK